MQCFLEKEEYVNQGDIKVSLKQNTIDLSNSSTKIDAVILHLFLENNSTLTGTAAILDAFADNFNITTKTTDETLPFDKQNNPFSIKHTQEHSEFIIMLKYHNRSLKDLNHIMYKYINKDGHRLQDDAEETAEGEEGTEEATGSKDSSSNGESISRP